jgi:hypothetical protein
MRRGQERRYLENRALTVAEPTVKRCPGCGGTKPRSEYYWRKVKLKTGPIERIEARCKVCIRAQQQAKRAQQRAEGVDLKRLEQGYRQKYLADPDKKRRAHERRREWAATKRRREGRPVRGSRAGAQMAQTGDRLPVEPIAQLLEGEIESLLLNGSAQRVIAERTQIGEKRIYDILRRNQAGVSLSTVDALLTGLGLPHELHVLYPEDQ